MTTTATASSPVAADLSPEVLWFLESRGIPVPDCPPKWRTPEPRDVPGAVFDAARVDRVLKAFGALRHTQGKWAGRPLRPDPWQIAYILAPVFGWVQKNDSGKYVRIIRNVYVDIPRKNGKTTLAGGIACYLTCADGENAGQVYAAAASTSQARFCFDPIKAIAEKSPALKPYVKTMSSRIIHKPSGSYFAVVSSAADLMHGANLNGAVVDELHVHKSGELLENIETGTGSRDQPLVVIITTPDDGRQATIYDQRRTNVERLSRGTIKDPGTYGVIWGAFDDDDPMEESTWKRANPGFGISPSREYLAGKATAAANSPAELSKFLRLHMGLRTKQETRYLDLGAWDRNAGMVDAEKLAGRPAYGGLDLATTSDLTALCWDFPDGHGGHDALWRIWVPELGFAKLNERTARNAEVWRRNGWLTVTPGDVADYDHIREAIRVDRERFNVLGIGYDPWNATQLVNDLVADEAPMVKVRQGFQTMSGPTKDFQRIMLAGTPETPLYRHGGNPCIRWQIDNFAVALDAASNVKPDKARAGDKIDGVVASIIALSLSSAHKAPRRSAYEDRGMEVV